MHYNPLAYIKNESDILKFVNALISNTKSEGKEGDPFWTKAETLLYCALLGYIIFEGAEEDRNMNTLVDMISGMEVKEDDEDFMNAVDYMFAGLEKRKPDCFAVKQYKKYKLSSGKTTKSILISCGARLAPFDIPQLREIMSYDELELDRMGDRRTATFFCISDTDSTYNFLVALAFSQMFNLLCERADNVHGGRLPHHVRVLWDEAANTGQVPGLEKLVAVIRSREVSLVLLYQQLAQCKAIYDKNAETILGNMDSVIFLGGREASTIKEISENWLGKSTISMQTDGRTRGQSESYSQNTQRLGRELMTPSELATMPGDRCILQLRGLPPFYSSKYDLKQHPNYKFTAEANKKNAFNLDRLINRRRRPGPKMAKRYEQEQGETAGKIKALRLEMKKADGKKMDMDFFLETIRRYTDATTITRRMVGELIDHIDVYHAEKRDGVTNQRVVIYYNCIGAFDVPDRRKIPGADIIMETRKGVALSYAPAQIAV